MVLVTINVSGAIFQTQMSTLKEVPNTRLSNEKLLADNYVVDKQHYFFDRDPQMFSYILNLYRTGELHLPPGVCGSYIRKELEFWMIPEDRVSECCWKELYQIGGDTEALRQLNGLFQDEITDFVHSVTTMSKFKRVRHRVWMFLEYPSSSVAAKVWEIFYFTLIILSGLVYLLDSVKTLRIPDTDLSTKCNLTVKTNITQYVMKKFPLFEIEHKYILTRPYNFLVITDLSLTVAFTAEFLIRFITSPRKCKFMKNILNLLDFFFLVCKYPLLYMEQRLCFLDEDVLWFYAVLKTFTAVRLFRLFRIGKSVQGFKVMLLSIKASFRELGLMVGLFMCITVLFAAIVYMAEMRSGTFENAFNACWWAMITMTTVGYGDIFPVSPCGQIIGAMCALTGLVVLTLPIAVIGTNFSQYYGLNKTRALVVAKEKKTCSKKKNCHELFVKKNKIGDIKITEY